MSTLLATLDDADRQHWLSNCEGFHVRSGSRHLGIVEFVRHGSDPFLPDTIHICVGVLRMREIAVPVDDVERLNPRGRTIWVRTHDPAEMPVAHRIAAWLTRVGALARTAQRTPRGAR